MNIELKEQLQNYIGPNTVIACIGTDKCIGDCLGPLVGTMLVEKGFKLPVYGTLDKPIHALNIHEQLNLIQNSHPNVEIIGIGACLGMKADVGKIMVRDRAIDPGKGVGKELPKVGIASIVGIVNYNNDYELLNLNAIRLSFVMDMAKQIVELIKEATKSRQVIQNSLGNYSRPLYHILEGCKLKKDIAEVIADINKIAVLINLQSKHHVFINNQGHVQNIEIKLYLGGWKSGSDASLSEDIYYSEYWGFEKSLKKLKKVRDTLYRIYKNGSINMGNCNYEIEEIKHYKFY